MAGNANSGRRTLGDIQKRRNIIDKAWKIVEEYLDDSNIPLKDRAEMASKLCVKDMPTELTGAEGEALIPPTIIFEYKKNDNGCGSTDVHAAEGAEGIKPEGTL